MDLVFIFLMTSGVEHLFICSMAICILSLDKCLLRDFPDGPVVKALHIHSRGHGFDPCQGPKILHAAQHSQKPTQKRFKREMSVQKLCPL